MGMIMTSEAHSTALKALSQIDPCQLDYEQWLECGMALKDAGCSVLDWDSWSKIDSKRYKAGECEKKWKGFNGSVHPVSLGTLVHFCQQHGGKITDEGRELDWNDAIGGEKEAICLEWAQSHEMPHPEENWKPHQDLIKYLSTLFNSDEYVCYVTDCWQDSEGKYLPKKGYYDKTAGELINQLKDCKGDLGAVIGDWKPEVGAWIKFNPLDGKGTKDENVTDFRYALVESDSVAIERQYDLYKEMELPIAALVHSGKKSLHAIVKVDATSYDDYRKRVDYLYSACKKTGLQIDKQNRNPSRLSRLPGVTRNGARQYLVATNIGKSSWQEWKDWFEEINDDLPDAQNLSDYWHNLPPLKDEVIQNILRYGHKMLIAGPSKAGKSFLLMSLCVAIAEGKQWIGWQCKKGKILYVNLELDHSSCLHRFKDVYDASGYKPENITNIDIWNLRGKAMPMDKLAPRLIRRAAKKKYLAIIIDPIYKVITGDENSAAEMAKFCNQFDKICAELGTATIYCHHHSKGAQGQKKASDRASGSGVFARDPDASVDILELEINDQRRDTIRNRLTSDRLIAQLNKVSPGWDMAIPCDDTLVPKKFLDNICTTFSKEIYEQCLEVQAKTWLETEHCTAWQIEGTLREFPNFKPKQILFTYPIHILDRWQLLEDAKAVGDEEIIGKCRDTAIKEMQDKKKEEIEQAFEALKNDNGEATIKELSEYLDIDEDNVRRRIRKYQELKLAYQKGIVTIKKPQNL